MPIINTIQEIIHSLEPGESVSLDERKSKRLLQHYSIPVVSEAVVHSEAEAQTQAASLGFPVVAKGFGSRLSHKSELGLVKLDLRDAEAVRVAFAELLEIGGADLEGVLLQPQIPGRREFLAGMFRDPVFGPVIMFGLGGVFAEGLADIALGIAPLEDQEAGDMLDQIRSASLLGHFRGDAPVSRDRLVRILTALSRIALDYPDIAEIDINPLKITPQGDILGVDALVVCTKQTEPGNKPVPHSPEAIGRLFYPKSVACIGASAQLGKWGHMLVSNILNGGFTGDIALVNPKGGTIAGQKTYRSVSEIPGPVDLAIVTIPAARVMDLIPELEHKGIKNMVLISSGFGETGRAGKALERDLVRAAEQAGILILGPNTMGLNNPHINFFCTGSMVQPRAGSTAMVSQSGNMGVQLLSFAVQQGIGIRAFSGSGNEAMLTIEDFMDGFSVDPLTKTVMLYLESVKDGPRFFRSAKKLTRKKPVILLKGGTSQAGNKAAASHTGAMGSDARVFEALCRQTGIIKVDGPNDLLDLSAAFSSLPLPRGSRVAIMTLGGGWGVITADLCAKYGLEVPELSPEIVRALDELLPEYWSRSNPVDLVGERDLSLPIKALEILLSWDGCDAVINMGILGRRVFVDDYMAAVQAVDPAYSKEELEQAAGMVADFEKEYIARIASCMTYSNKPVFGVRLATGNQDQVVMEVKGCPFKTVFYPSPEQAVKACAEMYRYYNYLKKN